MLVKKQRWMRVLRVLRLILDKVLTTLLADNIYR